MAEDGKVRVLLAHSIEDKKHRGDVEAHTICTLEFTQHPMEAEARLVVLEEKRSVDQDRRISGRTRRFRIGGAVLAQLIREHVDEESPAE